MSGEVSPLAAATRALGTDHPVRLVLLATRSTRPIADALVAAVNRVPDVFNLRLPVEVAQVEGTELSGGLAEEEVAAALAPYLAAATVDVRVLITWGSGSTQLALGSVEAAIRARLQWVFANVGSPPPAERYVVLDPGKDLGVDPLVPLVRRWRYHDLLSTLIKSGGVPVSEEIRQEVLSHEERWRQAYLQPTAENLRWLMTDALMRGDATSGFAVRAYVLAHYRQLRQQDDPPPPLDLIAWAEQKRGTKPLGRLLQLIRQEKSEREVTCSRESISGRWLTSTVVDVLNEAGSRAGHELAPPPAALRRSLRKHLAEVSADRPPVPDPTELVSALGAWYVAIVGKGATRAGSRPHPVQEVAETRADPEVAGYLGVPDPAEVDRRYLILGTHQGSAVDAAALAHRVNAVPGHSGEVAVADTVPDPAAAPPFDPDAAYALLRGHFPRVRADVGAVVLVPTGPKSLVLPLLMAGLRLAAQEGIPLFLRQMTSGAMHLLPVRFGTDFQLLALARHALDVLELDVAVRLLRSCSAGQELATRTDQLRRALRCEDPAYGASWPSVLPRTWSRRDRSIRLVAQRVEIWADLAVRSHQDPAHGMRAVLGAYAVLERSIRTAQPPQADERKAGERAWDSFTKRTRLGARSSNHHAPALCALFQVRHNLPISHGSGVILAPDVMIGRELRSPRPVAVADLLGLVAEALRRQFGDASAGAAAPRLSTLLGQLRADVSTAQDAELARLAHVQAETRQAEADLIDLLGAAALEAVAPPEPDA